jgi:hypothetical protein
MTPRLSTTAALGIVAALAFSASASAQVRSDRPIPVRKGETPVPARTDTVVVRDTVRMTDTVTVVRRDTVVQRVEVLPPPTPYGHFYWGLDGGAAIPVSALNTTHSTGYTAGLVLGWDSNRAPLGLRFDGGYTKLGERSAYACGFTGQTPNACGNSDEDDDVANVGDPALWHGNLDAKLRLPWMAESAVQIYLVGGATYNKFRGFTFIDEDQAPGNQIVLSTDEWHDKWGGNVGGGIAFGFGAARLFLESRFQSMNIGNSTQNHVPIVLGITF